MLSRSSSRERSASQATSDSDERSAALDAPRACNASGTAFSTEAAGWDFDDLDEQPGLGRHVRAMLRASPAERGPLLEKMP